MVDETRKGRSWPWQPTLLALLFLGPLVLAAALYYGSDRWRPAAGGNHGVLVQPPLIVPQLNPVEDPVLEATGDLRGRWTLIYVDAGSCDARCEEALHRSRNVREALGRNMVRLERIYLYRGAPPPDRILGERESFRVLPGDDTDASRLLSALPAAFATGDDLLLVDPLGNLMMRFPLDGDPQGMLADLKKLMKLSRIG